MPPETAVQDPPANATPGNEAPPKDEGTGPDGQTSQAAPKDGAPAPSPEGEGAKPGEGEEEVPERIKNLQTSAVEAWRAENEDRIKREALEEFQATQRSTQQDADFSATYNGAIKEISAALKGISVEAEGKDGQKVVLQLNDGQIQQAVHDRLNQMRGTVRGMEEAAVYDGLADAAMVLLGGEKNAEGIEAWAKEVGGKPIADWIKGTVEALAPTSAYVKTLTAQHKADKDAEYTRGWDEAMKAPPGTASMRNSKTTQAGKLTREGFLALTFDEQQKLYRERPAEVDALT